MIEQVNHFPVFEFVEARVYDIDDWPLAGTPAWCLLNDDDPAKIAAVLDAGRHWALRLDCEQHVRAEASRAISGSADWAAMSRNLRRGTSRAYIPRRVVA
jgi:hypothetical protein